MPSSHDQFSIDFSTDIAESSYKQPLFRPRPLHSRSTFRSETICAVSSALWRLASNKRGANWSVASRERTHSYALTVLGQVNLHLVGPPVPEGGFGSGDGRQGPQIRAV